MLVPFVPGIGRSSGAFSPIISVVLRTSSAVKPASLRGSPKEAELGQDRKWLGMVGEWTEDYKKGGVTLEVVNRDFGSKILSPLSTMNSVPHWLIHTQASRAG